MMVWPFLVVLESLMIPAKRISLSSFFTLAIGISPASSRLLASIFLSEEYRSLNSLAKSMTSPTQVELPVMSLSTFTPWGGDGPPVGVGAVSAATATLLACSGASVILSGAGDAYLSTSSFVSTRGLFSTSSMILLAQASASGSLISSSAALGSSRIPSSPNLFRTLFLMGFETIADVFK